MAEVLVIITSTPSSSAVDGAQRSMLQLLDAFKVAYTTVDGGEPANKELRTAAWAVSGKRVVYPQLFVREAGGELRFLGDWEALEKLNESNSDHQGLDAALAGLPRKE